MLVQTKPPKAVVAIGVLMLLCALLAGLAASPARAWAIEAPDDIPREVTGTCYIGETWLEGEQSFFTVPTFDGFLSGAVPSSTFECLDHTAAAPDHVQAEYTATLEDFNIEEGWIEYYVTITPPDVTDGVTGNEHGLTGYQHIGGSVRLAWDFCGGITLTKRSADAAITEGNGCYELQGATYGVFESREDAEAHSGDRAIRTMSTDSEGLAKTERDIDPGDYFVAELAASQGYALDAKVYPVTVEAGAVATVNIGQGYVEETPQTNPVELWVQKRDAESADGTALGAGSLANMEFTINYYDGYYDASNLPDTPTRIWIVSTDETGKAWADDEHQVGGDEYYRLADGRVTIPLGTVSITETRAPAGYLIDNASPIVVQVESEGTGETMHGYEAPSVSDHVIRGDFSFSKVAEGTEQRLASVPFLVMSKTTGEKHVIVTDANGTVSTSASWNAHGNNTNANDAALSGSEGSYALDEALLDCTAGIWFSGTANATGNADDSRGALPFDTYEISELRSSANEGYELVTFEVTVSRDNHEIDLGTVSDSNSPMISTLLADFYGSKSVDEGGEIEVIDSVWYSNLDTSESYTVKGTLHLVDDEGNDAGVIAESTAALDPTSPSGLVPVSLTVNTDDLDGMRIVAFEELYDSSGEVRASHEDLASEDQSMYVGSELESPLEPAKPATASMPKTGDGSMALVFVPIAAGALGLLGAALAVRQLKRQSRGDEHRRTLR